MLGSSGKNPHLPLGPWLNRKLAIRAGRRSVNLPRLQELDVRKLFLGHLQVDPVGGEEDLVAVAVEGHLGGGLVGEGAQVGVA